MHARPLFFVAIVVAVVALPAVSHAQDQELGQVGATWNLGELSRGAYPSTITAMNQSCPGPHDFHISLQGEAAKFLTIVGPTILTDIPPGDSRTSNVVVDVRTIAAGPHNEGTVYVKCVDCPVVCTQDYTLLAVHLTVVAEESPPDGGAAEPAESPWTTLDLTLLHPADLPPGADDGAAVDGLRWINPDALPATTLAQDALAEGLADFQFRGTGRAAGEIFTMTITRHTETPFEMGFELGTLVVPNDPRYATMIVADSGGVALLDEVTQVTLSGFSLDPTLELPPSNGVSDGPDWTIAPPPASGQSADAVGIINAAYRLAPNFSDPSDGYFRAVLQRALWFDAAPEGFAKDRLQQDVAAQLEVSGGTQDEEEAEKLAEDLWADLSSVINAGKAR